MFGLEDLALLVVALGVAWGMREYAPALLERALRRAGPQSVPKLPSHNDTPTPIPTHPMPLPDAPVGAMPTQLWRDMLAESPHLLIYGPSKAGKSTLAQAIVAMFDGCEYVVIDPLPNKPGESKWGGIDFVTLDDAGSDEYASIKRALVAVQAEDARRRRAMRSETPRQLIVIVDEVLALVDALGKTADKEPVISQFIRTMGYSARHRNIKIVLLGQGKNLKDLGLDSSTARNNYAMVRAVRDPSTNVRSAYIVADDKEVPIDLRYVPQLAQATAARANVWLAHRGCVVTPDADRILESLLGGGTGTDSEKAPTPGGTNQYERTSTSGTPDTNAEKPGTDDFLIVELVRRGMSANKVFEIVGGTRADVLDKVRRIRGE